MLRKTRQTRPLEFIRDGLKMALSEAPKLQSVTNAKLIPTFVYIEIEKE